MSGKYPEVTKKTIWNFRQNNPELIIQDAKEYLDLDAAQCEVLRTILLARGVNKWFKVRRDLIAYKKTLKHNVRLITETRKKHPWASKLMLPVLQLTEAVRADLKTLCNTDRMQIWPKNTSHHQALKAMNTWTASD